MNSLSSILTPEAIDRVQRVCQGPKAVHKRMEIYVTLVQQAYGIDVATEHSESVIKRIHAARAQGMPSLGEISDYLTSVGAR